MFGLNWPELVIISVVALIVIGPEDLPKMFRELGRFTGKLRQMSREFSRAMEQAGKDTGVSDVAKDLRNVTSPKSLGLDAVKDAASKFEKWDPLKNAAKPSSPTSMAAKPLTPPPMPATPAPSSLTSVAARDAAAKAEEEEVFPSILDEMAEDEWLADLEALDGAEPPQPSKAAAPEPTIHGPNTQALYDKAALRKKVLEEQTAKLKAIEAGTYQPDPVTPPDPVAAAEPLAGTAPAEAKAAPAGQEAAPEAETPAPETPVEKPKRSRAKAATGEAKAAAPKAPAAKTPATKSSASKSPAKSAEAKAAPKTTKKTRNSGEETA